jgi:hypothetical protein
MSSEVLPYLLSYSDAKLDEAYRRYQNGESQRQIIKALGIAQRTLARRCKEDGWEEERRARRAAAETPALAEAVAAATAEPLPVVAASIPDMPDDAAQPHETAGEEALPEDAEPEGRLRAMERMLAGQKRYADRLAKALDRAALEMLASVAGKPARAVITQINQLAVLGEKVLGMQRKAWCVPDKIETKDTTPTAADRVRVLSDEQLDRELEAAERAATAAVAREAASESVH